MAKISAKGAKPSKNAQMIAQWRERIEQGMKTQRLSMRQLSERSNLGSTTIRHMLKVAETTSLHSLASIADALGVSVVYLATGVHSVADDDGDATPKNLRILRIHTAEDAFDDEPRQDNGYIAVPTAQLHESAKALRVPNAALSGEGANAHVSPRSVLLPGDIIVWAKVPMSPGDLVVARGQGGTALVRILSEDDSGGLQLVANSVAFGRIRVKKADVEGKVIYLSRPLG